MSKITISATAESLMTAEDSSTFITRRTESIIVELGGIPGDRHYGLLRPADVRQKFYPRGVLIANRRQISIVSVEECKQIAENMGIPEVRPEWLGANICLSSIEDLTTLPLGSRLIFAGGTGLICEGENLPCRGPAKVIETIYGTDAIHKGFVAAAKKLRGIVCSVEKEGFIYAGESVNVITI